MCASRGSLVRFSCLINNDGCRCINGNSLIDNLCSFVTIDFWHHGSLRVCFGFGFGLLCCLDSRVRLFRQMCHCFLMLHLGLLGLVDFLLGRLRHSFSCLIHNYWCSISNDSLINITNSFVIDLWYHDRNLGSYFLLGFGLLRRVRLDCSVCLSCQMFQCFLVLLLSFLGLLNFLLGRLGHGFSFRFLLRQAVGSLLSFRFSFGLLLSYSFEFLACFLGLGFFGCLARLFCSFLLCLFVCSFFCKLFFFCGLFLSCLALEPFFF
mmetsp:Transcript_7982/g.12701  ORF Transcript_7982/g.12701 Transcript_7982/m.12701 type:complete len:264 (-) Transcript_7982:538-1329(-)